MNETFLLEGFPITSPRGFLGWANALLVDDGGTRIVIDTGAPGDRGTLIRRMEEVGLDPAGVSFLILTHLHFDHCLNLDLFPRAKIVLGRREHEYVSSGAFARAGDSGIPPYVLSLLEGRALLLVDGEQVIAPGVRVLSTPGHTPGSLSVLYVVEGGSTIACADLVKNGSEFLNGPPSAEAKATLERVRRRAVRWIPGHDRPFITDGRAIRYEGARKLEVHVMLDPYHAPVPTKWHFE